jgi:putative transposase
MAAIIMESVQHRQAGEIWFARLVLLMPDHLHALIAFPTERAMETTVRQWKGFLAHQFKIRWQRDFFDHRIRNAESWQQKANYIRQNPVRAGLIADAMTWPYVWEPR